MEPGLARALPLSTGDRMITSAAALAPGALLLALAQPAPSGGGSSFTPLLIQFGLIIAIPTLMFYRYFRGLVDAYTLELEQAAHRMVPHLMRFAVPR